MTAPLLPPRLLTRDQAAAYCGLSPESFAAWVKHKIVPGPLPGTRRYDRHALDLALDRRSGLRQETSDAAFARWLDQDNARQAEGHPQGPP